MAADFTATISGDLERLAPTTFEFIGDTTPEITGYAWNFGDGNASNEASPSHHWTATGPKTVSLVVIRTGGMQESVIKTGFVNIIPDTLDAYRNYLITKFKNRNTVRGFLTPHLEQNTLLDHVAAALERVRSFTGMGVQLDCLGEILGLPRLGRSDDDYRDALESMPAICRGYGQMEVLIAYTRLFLNSVHMSAFGGNMRVLIDCVDHDQQNYTLFKQRLGHLAAAGVRIDLAINEETPVEFEYTDEPPIYSSGNELSEDSYYNGGYLSEQIV